MSVHLSHFELDALRIGELPGERREAALRHLSTCVGCAARRDELDRSATLMLSENPPAVLATRTLELWESKRARAWPGSNFLASFFTSKGVVSGVVVATGMAVLLLLVVNREPDSSERLKGRRRPLEIATLSGESLSAPSEHPEAAPNSLLRLRFDPGDRGLAVLLWEDESGGYLELFRGAVFGPAWLERSIELDDSGKTERVHAIFCRDRLPEAGPLILSKVASDCETARLEVRKVRPEPRGHSE
ncbi:MAG: hypothetical protein HYV07_07245 [Deltaproteobacteria bacterium]|nr:hypothetical protein [Deltaproteobacteria bacterium]